MQAKKQNGGSSIDKACGALLYHTATRLNHQKRLGFLLGYIVSKGIGSEPQLTGMLLTCV